MTERDLSVPGGPAVLQLRILGTVSLTDADGREIRAVLTQPKRLALLAYLAVATPRGYQRRDTLLTLFWPEQDQAHARASLRKAVHVLRRMLGADVIAARGDEELAVSAGRLWCDAAAFQDAAAQGRAAEALELYRGDLLAGFFVPGAAEFERWHERERIRLRDAAAGLAWAMAERAAAEAHVAEASRWAKRAVGFTPDDESALRDLVTLLYRLGDRASALRAYDDFSARLQREFGARPSALTRRLVEDVRLSKDIPIPGTPGDRRSEAAG